MKLPKGYTVFDAADYIKSDADVAAYLGVVLEEYGDDPAFIAKALGTVARARGMNDIAKKTGLSRSSLYKALSGDRTPSLDTFIKVLNALDLKLKIA